MLLPSLTPKGSSLPPGLWILITSLSVINFLDHSYLVSAKECPAEVLFRSRINQTAQFLDNVKFAPKYNNKVQEREYNHLIGSYWATKSPTQADQEKVQASLDAWLDKVKAQCSEDRNPRAYEFVFFIGGLLVTLFLITGCALIGYYYFKNGTFNPNPKKNPSRENPKTSTESSLSSELSSLSKTGSAIIKKAFAAAASIGSTDPSASEN